MRCERGEHVRHLCDRCRNKNDVGARGFLNAGDSVNDAQLQRFLKIGSRAPNADHAAHGKLSLQRQRERAADETYADDGQCVDFCWAGLHDLRGEGMTNN